MRKPLFAKAAAAVLCCIAVGVFHAAPAALHAATNGGPVGMFEAHGDVGMVVHPGSTEYDAATKTYTIMGSGNNMWMGEDDFQFAWKKMYGDVSLTANISFFGLGSNPHRKGVLMIRQTLDADSVYVDAALHGNGLTALQYRDEKGAITKDIESADFSTQRMRLEKRGDFFYLYLSGGSADLHPAGASIRIPFKGDFYVGIGVCSHEKNIVETAMFSNVEVSAVAAGAGRRARSLQHARNSGDHFRQPARSQYVAPEKFEAPNWTRDGKAFLFQSQRPHPQHAGRRRPDPHHRHELRDSM